MGPRGNAPAQAVVLVALVVALGLVDALVGLLLVAPAAVVGDLAPGVAVPRRVPAQPAEPLHRRCSGYRTSISQIHCKASAGPVEASRYVSAGDAAPLDLAQQCQRPRSAFGQSMAEIRTR